MSLEKAEEALKAAKRCLEEGWYNSAVSRAYYAVFQAARAALTCAGVDRPWWSHGGLHATFSTELVRRRKLYPPSFVHTLAETMELRHTADYSDTQVPPKRAIHTTLLDTYVTGLILLAKAQCPEAVVEVLFTRYEDEDAHIFAFLPDNASEADKDRLGEVLTKRSVEILLDTGLLILAGVYDASHRRGGVGRSAVTS